MTQLQLDIYEGNKLKNFGMEIALLNANRRRSEWSIEALNVLIRFCRHTSKPFMAEDVRDFAEKNKMIEHPPSQRAWGAIFSLAVKRGIIRRIGFDFTKNPLAHRTPAALWESVNFDLTK